MTSIADNIRIVRARIENAERAAKRPSGAVRLLAVSKTHPSPLIRLAIAAGLSEFGESYLQEAIPKMDELADASTLCWHFIGPMQSNKTRLIAERFDWVHSVDRLKIAERLSTQRPEHLPRLQVCIQVNISDEASKSGICLDQVDALAEDIAALPRLQLRGLMSIPSPQASDDELRRGYRALRDKQHALATRFPGVDTLSMGMSDDLDRAVAEGATIVRIGTAIFGARPSGSQSRP